MKTRAALLLLLASMACAKKDDDVAAGGAMNDSASMMPAPAPAPAAPTVTDPQSAAIVVAANNVEIAAGRDAQKKSSNAKVKEFAKRMVTDHNGVNAAATALVKKLNVTPEESDASRGQTTAGDAAMASMKDMKGADFDRAYIANEVTYHVNLLDAIDKILLPSVQNAELRGLLEKTRPAVVAHLEHARELQASMGGGAMGGGNMSGGTKQP